MQVVGLKHWDWLSSDSSAVAWSHVLPLKGNGANFDAFATQFPKAVIDHYWTKSIVVTLRAAD